MIPSSGKGQSTVMFGWLLTASLIVLGTTIAVMADVGQHVGHQEATPGEAVAPETAAEAVDAQSSAQEELPEFVRIGEEVTGKVCVDCHGWDEIFVTRRTPRDWAFVVDDMVGRGAVVTEEQAAVVERYLAWSYGLVSVNSAPAGDFSAVLGLPMKDAEAIVAYRKTQGNFENLAGLLKVPGIDTAAVEALADALRFN
jgi:competence ComEA-like helix-hairpin-helix protein